MLSRRKLVSGGLAAIFAPAIIKSFPLILPKHPIITPADTNGYVVEDAVAYRSVKVLKVAVKFKLQWTEHCGEYMADIGLFPAEPDDPEEVIWWMDPKMVEGSDSSPRRYAYSRPGSKIIEPLPPVST